MGFSFGFGNKTQAADYQSEPINVGGASGDSMAGLGTLLQAGADIYNTERTNKANKQIAADANAMAQANAREQMAFQERLSNSAYQRAMDDMKKSGLNPILAYSQGGASTPSGAAGAVTTAKMEKADLGNRIEDFFTNPPSMKKAQNAANLTLTDQQGSKLASDQVVNAANVGLVREQAAKTRAETEYIEIRKINDEYDRQLKSAQTQLANAQRRGRNVETARAEVRRITEEKQARVDRYRADSQAEFDRKFRNIEMHIDLGKKGLNTANEAADLISPGRGFKKIGDAIKTRHTNSAEVLSEKEIMRKPEYNNGYHKKYRELELE